MPSEKELIEAVEGIKKQYDLNDEHEINDWLQTLLSLAQSVLDCKGWPEEMIYSTYGLAEIKPLYTKGYVEGFNDALRLCKLVAAKEKLNIPTVGEIERIIYNNKTALEAAVEICKLWGEK